MPLENIYPYLIHIGALVYVCCFLFRDQLYLRFFAVIGDIIYTLFYYGTVQDPFWAVIYSIMNMCVNIVMMYLIVRDRSEGTLNDRDMQLYQSFAGMAPGDFRRLKALGKWNTATADTVLTTEAERPERLYYIVSGDVDITKSGRKIPVEGKLFIGEIAYLQKIPASATVIAKPGCTYVSWTHDDLAKVTTKHEGLKQSLGNLLSTDLAMKVARA
jgi:Cyclic nucleotide-binding domain